MNSRAGLAAGMLDDAAASQAPIAFDAVRGALSASYCLLFAERAGDRQVEVPVVDGVDRAYGERLQQAAAERLLPPWLRGLDEGFVIDRAALARDHDFARSEFYNYVIRPEGRFHCLIATPYVTPVRRYHLIVGRPSRFPDFTPAETVTLRALLPHLGRLIAVANDAAWAAERSEGLMAAFDCLADNVAVVRGTGKLEFANAGARRLLALRDGLGLAGPQLRGMNADATAGLLHAIALVTAAHGPDETSVQLPRPSGSPPYQVGIRRIDRMPLGTLPDRAPPGETRAMLLIQQPDPQPHLDGSALGKAYGLTAREVEVALLLAQGCVLRAAAARLGLSYQTTRFHLRNAFSKMDVHRQSDLVRLVLQASPRLQRPRC